MAYYETYVESIIGGDTFGINKSFASNKMGDILVAYSDYLELVSLADTTLASSQLNACTLKSVDNLIGIRIYGAGSGSTHYICLEVYYIQNNLIISTNSAFTLDTITTSSPYTSLLRFRILNTKNGFAMLDKGDNLVFIKGKVEDINGNDSYNFIGNLYIYTGTPYPVAVANGANMTYYFASLVKGKDALTSMLIKYNAVLSMAASTGTVIIDKIVKDVIASTHSISYTGFMEIDSDVYWHSGYVGIMLENR